VALGRKRFIGEAFRLGFEAGGSIHNLQGSFRSSNKNPDFEGIKELYQYYGTVFAGYRVRNVEYGIASKFSQFTTVGIGRQSVNSVLGSIQFIVEDTNPPKDPPPGADFELALFLRIRAGLTYYPFQYGYGEVAIGLTFR
ncbi:hypothetical protein RZS08_43100, partial [Arthrospira platensis SPKY1]|nr:hypothetical protein [Arthrospira platensis SPKY1]